MVNTLGTKYDKKNITYRVVQNNYIAKFHYTVDLRIQTYT